MVRVGGGGGWKGDKAYLVVDVRDGRPLVEEGLHHLRVPRPRRQVEGRRPLAVLHIARRLVGQQQRHHVPARPENNPNLILNNKQHLSRPAARGTLPPSPASWT